MSNIFPHQRSLDFHTAACHVLRLACEKAVMLGALRPDDAHALQLAAKSKMHTGQVRGAIQLVFQLSDAVRLARAQMPHAAMLASKLLPTTFPQCPRPFEQEPK
jgi:hypothetical protein